MGQVLYFREGLHEVYTYPSYTCFTIGVCLGFVVDYKHGSGLVCRKGNNGKS